MKDFVIYSILTFIVLGLLLLLLTSGLSEFYPASLRRFVRNEPGILFLIVFAIVAFVIAYQRKLYFRHTKKPDIPLPFEDVNLWDPKATEVILKAPTKTNTDILFCKYCGKKVDADSVFCPFCGKLLKVSSEENTNKNEYDKIEINNSIKNKDDKHYALGTSAQTVLNTSNSQNQDANQHADELIGKFDKNGDYSKDSIRIGLYLIAGVAIVITILIFAIQNRNETELLDTKPLANEQLQPLKDVEGVYYSNSLGSFKYTGYVDLDDFPHGQGIALFEDGRYYKGAFEHNNLSGEGYFRYGNGDTFEGSFKNNSFYKGKYTIKSDGSYFIGTYDNGQPYSGTWYDNNGKEIERV